MVDSKVDNRIRKIAHKLAWKLAVDDRDELAKDLYQAGWLGFLSDTRTNINVRVSRARDFMVDHWVRWQFAVSRKSRKQRVDRCKLSDVSDVVWESFVEPRDYLAEVEVKDLLIKLTRRLDAPRGNNRPMKWRPVLEAMLEQGHPQILGANKNTTKWRKAAIRKEMEALLHDGI